MAKQVWLNNFEVDLTGEVKAFPDTGTPATEIGYGILQLSAAAGTILPVLTGGDWLLLTLFKVTGGYEADIEIVKVTAVDTTSGSETRITVSRAQEGTIARAYSAGDKVGGRMTAGTASNFLQKTSNLGDVQDPAAARGNLGAEPAITGDAATKYWRGNKTWSDFASDVRTATITGLSTATNAVISVGDTILSALGKLQAQITGHSGASSGAHAASAISNIPSGNIAATTVQTAINELDSEKQSTLVSGTNIKTAGGQNLVGSGDAPIVAPETHAATAKTTPADADEMGLSDSAASWALKKFTFANLKAWLTSAFLPLSGGVLSGPLGFGAGLQLAASVSGEALEISDPSYSTNINMKLIGSPASASENGDATFEVRAGASFWSVSAVSTIGGGGVSNMSSNYPFGISHGVTRIGLTGNYPDLGTVLIEYAGFGYHSNSRGSVTQSTSHTTAVTLNAICGTITMASASLAASGVVSFVFNNSALAAGDVIIFSAGNVSPMVAAPIITTKSVTAGSCTISVRNGDATARTCAPVINFAIIKGGS